MSSSQGVPPAGPTAAGGVDPSMEDILASIRRILNEDDGSAPPASEPAAPPAPPVAADVLTLDSTMLVHPPEPSIGVSLAGLSSVVAPGMETHVAPSPPPVAPPQAAPAPAADSFPHHSDDGNLVAPEAAAAASASMGELMRTLASERHTAIYRGGPTLEDMVRDEMRPLLKIWLDTNLPPMVERLVRAEIDRVVSRDAS